jgi:hypothetical protein
MTYVPSEKASASLGVGAIERFTRGATAKLAKEKKEKPIQFTPIAPLFSAIEHRVRGGLREGLHGRRIDIL